MKVLVAIADKDFGNAIKNFITSQQWPAETIFRLVHVVEPELPAASSGLCLFSKSHPGVKRLAALNGAIEEFIDKLHQALPDAVVEKEIVNGYAKNKIVTLAKGWGADLIVLGSHTTGGSTQFPLGSVASSVVSLAPCSVTVVRLGQQAETTHTAQSNLA